MIYVASPYSSPIATVVEQRVQRTMQFVGLMLQRGFPVFSPIAYFHPFATAFKLPTDAGFWHQTNMQFLRKAECVWVLRLVGWEQSKGLIVERRVAKTLAIPIIHFDENFQPLINGAPEDDGRTGALK